MSMTHKPAVSQRAANHVDAQEKDRVARARTKAGGTPQADAQSAHLTAQRNMQLGIQHSPYTVAQREQIAALMQPVQRNAGVDAKVDEEEKPLTVQPKSDPVQRLDDDKPELKEEELPPAQTKSADGTGALVASPAAVQREAEALAKRNDTGLPDNLKSGIESLSGLSMDSVKVHYNSEKPAQLNALAYAQGTDIHVAPGQEQHLPHEAWHVVQQAQGRVQPNMQMKEGVPVNDDPGLEHEADVMGAKAMSAEALRRTGIGEPQAALQARFQGRAVQPLQRERALTLEHTLATRMENDDKTRTEVLDDVSANDLLLEVYRLARDHAWNIDPGDLLPDYREAAGKVRDEVLPYMLQTAIGNTEAKRAEAFGNSYDQMIRQKDNISVVLRHYRAKAENKSGAELYLAGHQTRNAAFDFDMDGENAPQYEAEQAGFFGPDQSSLDIGVSIANRVLREAFAHDDQADKFFRIAKAIQTIGDSDNEALVTASSVLQDYLKPKLTAFINTLPLGERNGQVWNGKTLNDDIKYADDRALERDDTWVRPNVRTAWTSIRNVVSPAVLNHAGVASVQVDGALSRPFYSSNRIHVGWMRTSVGMVMHEFGHHLEDNTQVPRWIKLQQLLRDRSNGGELTRIFPISLPYVISRDEMRYDAPMPAKGVMGGYFSYSAKYYPYGSTEVVATSLEMFHDREKSYQIAIRDPELFLAVMGVLRA